MAAGMRLLGMAETLDAIEQFKRVFGPFNAKYLVGTNVEYAVYVELGTSQMAAQPYLRPAARKVANNIDRYVDDPDGLEDALAQIARAIEREAKELCPVDTGNLRGSITAVKVN